MGRGWCRKCVLTGSWSQVAGTRARRRGRRGALCSGSPEDQVEAGIGSGCKMA